MPLPQGTMTVRVLDDGTLRIETGDMGGVTHQAADAFLKEVQRLMGGTSEVKQTQKHGHTHSHGHDHEHGHDHHHH